MSISAVAAAILSILLGQPSAITDTIRAEKERLNACIEKIETHPGEAYEDALAWLNEGARPNARYCAALSLSALGHHAEAASRLEALAKLKGSGTLGERAVFLTQAGNAWLSAGLADESIIAFTNALKLQKTDPELYKDRAAALMAADRNFEATQDLNQALTFNPIDAEAYRMRALSYLLQDAHDLALQDIETSMRYDPSNIDTLLLRGEIREAKRNSR